MKINESIFKAYDIRGTYPEQINRKTAFCIGSGFAELIKDKSNEEQPLVIIGRDARPSSPEIFEGLLAGIGDKGGEVVEIGTCSTPLLYFGVNHLEAEAGIMITASHNPPQYNGMKLVGQQALPLKSEEIDNLEQKALQFASEAPEPISASQEVATRDISTNFVDFLIQDREISLPDPIVVDCGNGMSGPVVGQVLSRLGVEYKPLYFEPDCSFPNHEANPLKEETLDSLKSSLEKKKAFLGVAFDGDGDRVGFVDENGNIISGDMITALLSRKILKEKGGGAVVYDLRSSKIVPEIIKKFGGEPIESRVGYPFIRHLMKENDAVSGGELSSHFYFPFQFEDKTAYFESGILALLEILELISETGKSLSELVEPLQEYVQSGEVNFELNNKKEVMEKLEEHYEKDAERISHLDGIKLVFKDWWFNLRPSNTEPYLRLNLEAETKKMMEEKLEEVRGLIKEYGE